MEKPRLLAGLSLRDSQESSHSVTSAISWKRYRLLEQADERHIGSIDVDSARDAKKHADGRYADLLKLLLATDRYRPFQLVVEVHTFKLG